MKRVSNINKVYFVCILLGVHFTYAKTVSQNETRCLNFYKGESLKLRSSEKIADQTRVGLSSLDQKSFYSKDYKTGEEIIGNSVLNRLDRISKNLKSSQASKALLENKKRGLSIVNSLLQKMAQSKTEKNFLNKNDVEAFEDFLLKYVDIIDGKNIESITSFNEVGSTVINEFNLNKGKNTIYDSFNQAFEIIFGKEESGIRKARLRFCK